MDYASDLRWSLKSTNLLSWIIDIWRWFDLRGLTHWGKDKMAAIFFFSNSRIAMIFLFKFYWYLLPRVLSTVRLNGPGYGLAPKRRQAIIWSNDGLVYSMI